MKSKIKNLLLFFLIIVILISLSSQTFAYALLGQGQLSGGAQNILYWRDSSCSGFTQSIDYGIQYWNNKTSKVSVARTTTQSYSRCDCYYGNYFTDPGVIAGTLFYLNNVITTDFDTDWYWCEIYFDSTNYNLDDMTYFDRKGTSCHEYGHVLGLDHVWNPAAVMCQLGLGRTVNSPQYDDVNGIIWIYGN